MYIDQVDDIVNKYNNTINTKIQCHSTIKIKPVDVKPSKYIDSGKEITNKVPKFKIGDIDRISNVKTFLQFMWLKKLKTPFRGHMLLEIL